MKRRHLTTYGKIRVTVSLTVWLAAYVAITAGILVLSIRRGFDVETQILLVLPLGIAWTIQATTALERILKQEERNRND